MKTDVKNKIHWPLTEIAALVFVELAGSIFKPLSQWRQLQHVFLCIKQFHHEVHYLRLLSYQDIAFEEQSAVSYMGTALLKCPKRVKVILWLFSRARPNTKLWNLFKSDFREIPESRIGSADTTPRSLCHHHSTSAVAFQRPGQNYVSAGGNYSLNF